LGTWLGTWTSEVAEFSRDSLRGEFAVTEDKRLIVLTIRSELRGMPTSWRMALGHRQSLEIAAKAKSNCDCYDCECPYILQLTTYNSTLYSQATCQRACWYSLRSLGPADPGMRPPG